jgi:hypothetical protein
MSSENRADGADDSRFVMVCKDHQHAIQVSIEPEIIELD